MLSIGIVCLLATPQFIRHHDLYVGVDRGALILAQAQIKMDCAIGDFDSISKDEMEIIQAYASRVIKLHPIKNESDLEAALKIYYNQAEHIIIYGALGGRLDHQYVNVQLMKQYPQVELVDDYNHCMIITQSQTIQADHFKYFSIFALEESVVSITQAKYELSNVVLMENDLYTLSNEFITKEAHIELTKGRLLLIKSKDK